MTGTERKPLTVPRSKTRQVGRGPIPLPHWRLGTLLRFCQAWRRFDLRVTHYPAVKLTVLAVAIYLNFFTHHVLPDVRWVLIVALLIVLRRTWVYFTVGLVRVRLPLAVAFVLVATIKATEGRLYGHPSDQASVTTSR